jgi:hypothetical protein
MVDVALATLKPVVRELEIASFKNEAHNQIEKETNDAAKEQPTKQPTERVRRTPRTASEGGAGDDKPTGRVKRKRR